MNLVLAIVAGLLDWVARLNKRHSSHNADGASQHPVDPAVSAVPHSRFGGRAWSFDASGVRAEGRLWRTPGEPVTCRAIMEFFGDLVIAVGARHGIDPALLVMTIATEAGSFRAERFTGPGTFRWEPHVANLDQVPSFKGSYSAGPMQVLATTARDLIATRGTEYGLGYRPTAVAPAYREKPRSPPASLPLYDPAISIDLGAAVIRRGLLLTGNDPILVAAAYNSGGLYASRANPWHLRSHGNHLDRAARWYGDACLVLRERGHRRAP